MSAIVKFSTVWFESKREYALVTWFFFHTPICRCQKQITFNPRQFLLQGSRFKKKVWKMFPGIQTTWNNFSKPAVNVAALFVGMAVSAETKNLQFAQVATNVFRSISGSKNLSLTDMHGHGLRLRVTWFYLK